MKIFYIFYIMTILICAVFVQVIFTGGTICSSRESAGVPNVINDCSFEVYQEVVMVSQHAQTGVLALKRILQLLIITITLSATLAERTECTDVSSLWKTALMALFFRTLLKLWSLSQSLYLNTTSR